MRELRNQGAQVIARVAAGETLTVTRDGEAVAEIRPLRRKTPRASELLARWAKIPPIDPECLRQDIDALIDQTPKVSMRRLELHVWGVDAPP